MIQIKQITNLDKSVIFEFSNLKNSYLIWDYNIINNQKIEIQKIDINNIFNELLHIDDITIIANASEYFFKKLDYNYRLTEQEIKEFKFKPFAHQIDAINFGLKQKHKKWLLLDSMGLG